MIREAESHADEAHKMREAAEARNQAENLLYSTEKSLKDHRDALDEETVTTIESRMEELRSALDVSDAAEIRAKSASLTEASHRLAQAVYEKVQAEQAASGATAGGNGTSDEEVVEDAEYEVIDEEANRS